MRLCETRESHCSCTFPLNHDGPHSCPCGGSWERDADGELVVHSYPSTPLPGSPGALGIDPIMWWVMTRGPFRASRGPIRFLLPPVTVIEADDGSLGLMVEADDGDGNG